MKRLLPLLIVAAIMSGCAGTSNDIRDIIESAAYSIDLPAERLNLVLGVAAGPYGDMFMESITPALATKGYTVNVVVYNDFIQPNMALANNEIDLNMFQHTQYLNNFKLEHDLDLSAIAEIPTVSMGVFSDIYANLDEIETGAVVAIPDDATNLARALRVLESAGVITLDPQIDKSRATENDISRNQRGLVFVKVPATELVEALSDNDMAVVNGNFAFAGGLDIAGALYNEVLQEGYINVIAVRTEDLPRQFVRDIIDIINSQGFRDFITEPGGKFNGFQRPRYMLT